MLVCGGVNGDPAALERLASVAASERPDAVLFAGGVLSHERSFAATATSAFGYTDEDGRFIDRFFTALGRLGVFTAVIPGLYDAPLEQFLRAGMSAELTYPTLHLVHGSPAIRRDVAVFGVGGLIADYTDGDIGYFSWTLARYLLRPLWQVGSVPTVLMLAGPPAAGEGMMGDRTADGLIASYHPRLCVLPSHEPRGRVDRVAGTTVVNPGGLAAGSAAWVDWGRGGAAQVTLLELPEPAGALAGPGRG
jgi:hypothetical protein